MPETALELERLRNRVAELEGLLDAGGRLAEDGSPESRAASRYDIVVAPLLIWERTGDGFVLGGCNRAALMRTGGSVGGLVGGVAAELLAGRPEVVEDLELCATTGRIVRRETKAMLGFGGRDGWLQLSLAPGEGGRVTMLVEDATDREASEGRQAIGRTRALMARNEALEAEVAERKRVQEVLRQRERTVWTLLNATMDMAYLIDAGGVIRATNERYARRFGMTAAEIVGREARSLYPENIYDQRLERIRTVIRSNTAVRFEEQFDQHYTDVQITPICNAEGVPDMAAVFVRDMTRRRLAEQAVRRSRELFSQAMAHGNTGVWEYWPRTRRFGGDINLKRLLGFAEDELGPGLAEWTALVPAGDLPPLRQFAARMGTGTHAPLAHELRVITRDGELRWMQIRGRRADDWLDGSLRYIGCAVDITERKQAEEALEQSRKEFKALAENSPDLIMRLDRTGRLLYTNPAVVEATGLDPSRIVGRTCSEICLIKGEDGWDRTREEVFAFGRLRTVEFALEARGGRRHYQCVVAPERDVAGAVETVVAVARDITARKAAEDEMRNLARFPSENPNPVLRLSPDGVLFFANKASEHLLAALKLSLGGRAAGEFGDEVRAAFRRQGLATSELRFADGRAYSLALAPFPDGGYINVYANEITPLLRAEEAARQREQQLIHADKMISLGILSAGVAHEVNNPNNFIMVNVPILEDAWSAALPLLDAYAAEHGPFRLAGVPFAKMRDRIPLLVDGIKEGARRIKDIVHSMKDFARQDDSPSLDGEVDVNELIHASLTLLANTLKRSTAHFSADYAETLPMVRGNFGRLEQVFVNVLLNACQALPAPDRALSVRTSYEADAGRVCVAVQDQGEGIAPQDLARVFDPFFTTKREQGGMGLGLSISNTIIKEHGGDLIFESTPGKGTCVTISLPAAHLHGRRKTKQSPPSGPARGAQPKDAA